MVKSLIALCTLIGIVFSGYFYFESHYALAKDLKKVETRLDYKITSDQLESIQERIWKIEDRFYNKNMPNTVKEEYRNLLEDKEDLKGKLKILKEEKD